MNELNTPNFDPEQHAVLTDIGKQKLNALIAGQELRITQMALGDGNGQPVTPSAGGRTLVNEIGRESLTDKGTTSFAAGIFMSTEMANKYKGQWLREVGLIDEDGDLIVWACMAETLVSLFSERTIMAHLPIENRDQMTIVIDTTKQYVTVSEFELFKESIQSLLSPVDYTEHAVQLADTSNVIYATLPASVMAVIPAGIMRGISDGSAYPLFTPRPDIEYALSIMTSRCAIGFEQTLTIIERTADKQDINLTFKRSGQTFEDATVWASMVGLPPNQDLVVDNVFFRGDCRAVDM